MKSFAIDFLAEYDDVRLEVHHRQPFAKNGPDALDNLETLCFECNRWQRDDFT